MIHFFTEMSWVHYIDTLEKSGLRLKQPHPGSDILQEVVVDNRWHTCVWRRQGHWDESSFLWRLNHYFPAPTQWDVRERRLAFKNLCTSKEIDRVVLPPPDETISCWKNGLFATDDFLHRFEDGFVFGGLQIAQQLSTSCPLPECLCRVVVSYCVPSVLLNRSKPPVAGAFFPEQTMDLLVKEPNQASSR